LFQEQKDNPHDYRGAGHQSQAEANASTALRQVMGRAGQPLLGIVACCYTPALPLRYEEELNKTAGRFRPALRYTFYDWTRETPSSKRAITWCAILLLQGYAIYALRARSFIWPLVWPKGPVLYFLCGAALLL
jgi:hypothetical protein